MTITRVWHVRVLRALTLLLLSGPAPLSAQLRPLPPMHWEVFEADRTVSGSLGAAFLVDQRASLAGTEGHLLEAGEFAVAARSGRIAVEVGGTALRIFEDREVWASPWGGATESNGERRRDVGDIRVSTMVRLTAAEAPAAAVLRFGTRLPTTDNEVGLERDRTDFFALLAGRLRRGDWLLAGEAGVGIHGTHDARLEQSDVLMYSAMAAYRGWPVSPRVTLVGHMDGMSGLSIRGNEELAEVRAGVRVGGRWWGEAELVRGLQPFSPRSGLLLRLGMSR